MNNRVRVIVSFKLKDKYLNSINYLNTFVNITKKSHGCLGYEFLIDSSNPNQFTFLELWEDKEALVQHTSSSYFRNFAPFFAQHFDALKVRIMNCATA